MFNFNSAVTAPARIISRLTIEPRPWSASWCSFAMSAVITQTGVFFILPFCTWWGWLVGENGAKAEPKLYNVWDKPKLPIFAME